MSNPVITTLRSLEGAKKDADMIRQASIVEGKQAAALGDKMALYSKDLSALEEQITAIYPDAASLSVLDEVAQKVFDQLGALPMETINHFALKKYDYPYLTDPTQHMKEKASAVISQLTEKYTEINSQMSTVEKTANWFGSFTSSTPSMSTQVLEGKIPNQKYF